MNATHNTENNVAGGDSAPLNCSACGDLRRENFHLQIRLEGTEDAIKNLVEKIEQLENWEVYDGLNAQFLEPSE